MTGNNECGMQRSSTMKQTIVAHLEAPRLIGTTTKDFTNFMRERQLYEKQIEEKNLIPGTHISPVTYKTSIDDNLLQIFIIFGWISAKSIVEITEKELKDCIQKRSSRNPKDHELSRVDAIVNTVQMNMDIPLLEDRVYDLVQKYLQVLESSGLKDLPKLKPHVSIKHILKRLKPHSLYKCMSDIIEWRKNEQFERKDFGLFVQELAKQAVRLDEDGSSSIATENGRHASGHEKKAFISKKTHFQKRHNENRNFINSHEKKFSFTKRQKGNESTENLPVCLNKNCFRRHYMNDCKNTSPEEKKRLITEFRLNKKRGKEQNGPFPKKKAGNVNEVSGENIQRENSSLFSASFCKGAVESIALTDQGSDINLVSPSVLQQILAADKNIKTHILNPPKIFSSVVQNVKVTCHSYFKADIQLRIRHGTNLIIRSVKWLVGDAENEHVIIGRPLLDSLGCSNEKMLAAACDRNEGSFNAENLQPENDDDQDLGFIEALQTEGIFHSAGGDEDEKISDDIYVDIGEDKPGEVEKALEDRVKLAIENGLSLKGAQRLRKVLEENISIFE